MTRSYVRLSWESPERIRQLHCYPALWRKCCRSRCVESLPFIWPLIVGKVGQGAGKKMMTSWTCFHWVASSSPVDIVPKERADIHRSNKVGHSARRSLAGGIKTGKHTTGQPCPAAEKACYWHPWLHWCWDDRGQPDCLQCERDSHRRLPPASTKPASFNQKARPLQHKGMKWPSADWRWTVEQCLT